MSNLINQGESLIIREGELRAYLQTSCGLVYYADGIVGFAHSSLVPSEYRNLYIKGAMVPEGFLVTPTQAAEELLQEMLKQGVEIDKLKAYIFGCRMEQSGIGKKNADEARGILKQLRIPIKFNFANLLFDTDLTITPEQIKVKLTNCLFHYPDLERIIRLN